MMRWFHKLKVAQKLTLVSVFFMIPDSVMLYLFITSINENIHVAKLEQRGNEYQRAVEPLLQLIPRHRLVLHTQTPDHDQLQSVEKQIDEAFKSLQKVDRQIGAELDFTPAGLSKRNRANCAVDATFRDWQTLRADCERPFDEAGFNALDQRHLDLIARVRGMIAHAGDTSNLILDPELDSYYLMDTTLLALPQTQDRLTQVMLDGLTRLRSTGAAHNEKVALAIDSAFLRHDDLERIQNSTQIAIGNPNPDYGTDENFGRRVPPLLKKYADATSAFADLLDQLQSADRPDVSEAQWLAAGEAAREASFGLWYASDAELDRLLQHRIDYYVYRRARSLGVAACALLAAVTLVAFITRSISGPLQRQAAELRKAYLAADTDRKLAEQRLGLQQKAEAQLRAAQDQLVAASRQAGMAEVATGVLHNVGNVLNSVNVSAQLLKDQLQGSQVSKLNKTADMIDAHEHDLPDFLGSDARGKLIPGYVSKLARLLKSENTSLLSELQNLQHGMEHIKQVVQFQQNYATPSNLRETLDPAELLEDALRLHTIALDRHGVTIVREVEEVGRVSIDKHKTLQILVNLMSNAKIAMKDLNENKERRLTLRLSVETLDERRRLRFEIADNGCGIASEHLPRIFEHGFTTRAQGHGFGLHTAINAAREMGGSLEVASAGVGQGATFTLVLPLEDCKVPA